jgi:predicted AAA+ superfamily ATPase
MKRILYQYLSEWRASAVHKPIIMRGARQVGKTYLADQFGQAFDHYVSINLEKEPELIPIFDENLDPKRITRLISLHAEKPIIPGKTLLFIDEIQDAPRALLALRYFYEEMPELHVIAAGSLLEFAIEEVGVPVGRVNFIYVYPLSFVEFLLATKRHLALEAIMMHTFPDPVDTMIHKQFLGYLGEYLAIGGMPEAVVTWCDQQDLAACQLVHQSIIQAYKQDFSKYAKRHQIKYVDLLFREIPQQASKPFRFSKVSGEYRKRDLLPALNLSEKAGIQKPIYNSSGQGVPIDAQSDYERFKCLFLDVALAQSVLGYDLRDWFFDAYQGMINKGEIIEMFVGQEMLAYAHPFFEKHLYYWENTKRGSVAEVDYLIEDEHKVIPIEVKSGNGKKLKRLHSFLQKHPNSPYGIHFSALNYMDKNAIRAYPIYAVANLLLQDFV